MIIKIENYNTNYKDDRIISSVENILRSFYESKHILIAEDIFFKDIVSKKDYYSYSARNAASAAISVSREHKSLLDKVSFYVVIDFSFLEKTFSWFFYNGLLKFNCGPLYFDDSSKLQATKIIFENPDDSDFFKIIALNFARKNNINKKSIRFTPLNGGGNTTKKVFDREKKDNGLLFCIVDNDKKHPKGTMGSTCKALTGNPVDVNGLLKTDGSGVISILDVHEIESLIPFDTIENTLKTFKTINGKGDSIAFFMDMCSVDESAKFYFDHKKGFNICDALTLDESYGVYWSRILKQIIKKSPCLTAGSCHCEPVCLSYCGFGDRLLVNTVEYINKYTKSYNPKLTPLLEDKWNAIGKTFYSWTCCPQKKVNLS